MSSPLEVTSGGGTRKFRPASEKNKISLFSLISNAISSFNKKNFVAMVQELVIYASVGGLYVSSICFFSNSMNWIPYYVQLDAANISFQDDNWKRPIHQLFLSSGHIRIGSET